MVVHYGFNQRPASIAHAETRKVIPVRLDLAYLDPAGLISKINANIADDEDELELEDFESRDPRKNSFLYKVTGVQPSVRGKFPITQTGNYGLLGLVGIEIEIAPRYL